MEVGVLVAAIGSILGCVLPRKKYNYSFSKALTYAFIIVALGIIECKVMSLLQSFILNSISDGVVPVENGIRFIGVIVFEPLFILPLVFLSGEKYRKIMDYAVPGNIMALMFGKVWCHIEGCCHGIPFENGVYNELLNCNVFPVQLSESVTSLIAIATVYVLLYKCPKIRKGSLFPIGSIIYCITRIVWEEYRYYDNEWQLDFLFGLNTWQFWCMVSIITCVIWLLILYLNPEYSECSFEVKDNAPFDIIKIKLEKTWSYLKHRNDKNIIHHKKKKKK